jgi:uncharacterized lipoprotein YmbA
MTPMRLLPLLLAIAAAGCAELTREPTLYVLPEPAEAPASSASLRGAVAVATFELPDYAEAASIVTRAADGSIVQSDLHAWGDPLARSGTRIFAAELSRALGRAALAEPWPITFDPAARVDVLVDRFDGAPDGAVRLIGEYRLADGRGLRRVSRFQIDAPVETSGWTGLAAAHSAALAELARRVAADLEGRG